MKFAIAVLFLASFCQAQYTETILYSFVGGSDGSYPVGGLVMDSKGTLYGTTQLGGYEQGLCEQGGCGTVFKLANGVKTVLHQFTAGTDGAMPNASLVIDKSGNIYGTTVFGGLGYGIVFKVSAGKYSILHTFGKTAGDGKFPLGPVTLDGSGNLYGVTSDVDICTNDCPAIKDQGWGTIFKITDRGVLTNLYSFTGLKDGGNPIGNVVRDSAGNLYGTTSTGGAYASGTFWKLSTKNVLTTIYAFCAQQNCADGSSPSYFRRSSSGNFYLSLYSVDNNGYGGGLAEITAQGTESVIYNFCGGVFSCADGYGLEGPTTLTGGTVYGTTGWGGTYGVGAVYSVSGSQETPLYSFDPYSGDGTSPMGGVIEDSEGNLYGTTQGGGAGTEGTIWKLTKN